MKQYMKFIMTMALLLTTMSVWAEQNVTIVVNPSASAGTVTQKVENGVCTLTVTPASGYYLTAENLTVVTCLDGSGVQSPRRATDIEIKSETLEVTALNATADPSGVTSYTFTMPEDETIGVEVTAEFQTLIAITPTVTLESWTYGEAANTPVVEGNPGNGEVTFTYAVKGSTTFTNAVPATAGNYTVKANVAAAMQYAAGEATADFSISKAAITEVTLEETPLTYTGEEQTVTIASVMASELELTEDDYDVSGNTATDKGTYTVTVTAKENSNFSGSKTATFTIEAKSIATGYTVTVDAAQTYTYTGEAIEPAVTVTPVDGGSALTSADYDVTYANNINATLSSDNLAPTVTVTGKGNYTGSASATFTIGKANATITQAPTAIADLVYNGEAQALVEAGTVSAGTMVYSTALDGTFAEAIPTGTNAGSYTVYYKVNGTDNYNGIEANETNKVTVTIGKAEITEVTLEETAFTYTGEEQTATIASVKAGDLELTADDYDVVDNTATDKGSYELTVTAKENSNFSGTKTATFTIGAANIAELYDISLEETSFVYDGTEHEPAVVFMLDDEPIELSGDDYEVAYSNNVNVGSAGAATGAPTVTVTGKGNYTGSKTLTFTITALSLEDATVAVDATKTYTYTGEAITPNVTVSLYLNDELTTLTADDYTVSYANNINAALSSDNLAPTVTVTGKGNYTGSASATFTIGKANATITKAPTAIAELVYSGQAQALVEAGTVSAGSMVYSTSLDGTFAEAIPTGTNAGSYTVYYKVNGTDNYNGIEASQTNKVTVTIGQAEITEVVLEEATLAYCGEAQTPTITKVMAGDIEVGADYYEITSGNAKTDVGEYELTVAAKTMEGNNFKGSATVEWSIVNRTLVVGEDVTFAANQKWASFVSPSEDLLLPEGMMAFIVTEIGASSVTVKAINYVPKDEPVLLEIDTEETTTNSSAAGNLLQAASEATNVSSINGTVYGLYNNSMMRVNTGTIAKGKCYLVVNAQQSAPRLTIEKDGEATGIENITTTLSEGEEVWYSIDGKKLQKPTSKGIYIVKGKKMVIK